MGNNMQIMKMPAKTYLLNLLTCLIQFILYLYKEFSDVSRGKNNVKNVTYYFIYLYLYSCGKIAPNKEEGERAIALLYSAAYPINELMLDHPYS